MKLLLSFGQVDFVTQPRYESMFDPTTSTRSSLAPSSLPVGRYVSHYLGVRRHLRDHYSPNIQVGTINIKITLKCQYESVSHIYKFYLLVIPWYHRVIERCFHFNSLTKNKGIRIHCLPQQPGWAVRHRGSSPNALYFFVHPVGPFAPFVGLVK